MRFSIITSLLFFSTDSRLTSALFKGHKKIMLPLKKRAYRGDSYPSAKRVRRLERRVRAQRAEMKCVSFQLTGTVPAFAAGAKGTQFLNPLQINQGDQVNNRAGNKIKVWRVEIRGAMTTCCDGYLLQLHGNPAFTEAEFTDSRGCYLLPNVNNTIATEWAHFTPSGTNITDIANFRVVRNFKGMEVRFNGTTATAVDNGINIIILNATATVGSVDLNCRVWFTDA